MIVAFILMWLALSLVLSVLVGKAIKYGKGGT
jgi:hypothetical protein